MAKKFLTGLNLVVLNADPATGSEGELYFNSSASVAKIYQAGAWSVLGAGGGGGSTTVSTTEPASPEVGDSWYKNDTGEFYVYDGTYWVEVNGVIENPPLTQEQIQDYIAPLLTHANHTNASVTYEDALNELRINVTNAPTAAYTAVLKHDVRLNGSIAKGQAVYVTSANGTNMIVSKASNTSEATSSKTLGLLETGGSNNAQVKVVTEGLLAGLDTSTAGTEGDPVWLGTNGNLIYGLANKPVAPAHLVFIGIVTRKNNSNGEIFVKVQNGFELRELHTVLLEADESIADNEVLAYDTTSSLWINQTAAQAGLATASQLSNYLTISSASSTYSLSSHNHTLNSLSNVNINSLNNGEAIVWNSASAAWVNQLISGGGGGGATTTVSETAPVTPTLGDTWYKQSTGSFFIYDGNYWVEVNGIIDSLTGDQVQDYASTLFSHNNHTNITATYDDANNQILLNVNLNPYLTQASASSTYLTQAAASSTYLTQASGLTQASASNTYLTKTTASTTYATKAEVIEISDITPLDNIKSRFDGFQTRFLPTYLGNTIAITNPYRLFLNINGIIQMVEYPELVWGSPLPRQGFWIDDDGYIVFSEAPLPGSTFDARMMAGSTTTTKTKLLYPFEAADILLGE